MVRCKYRYSLIQIKLNDNKKDDLPFKISSEELVGYFKSQIQKHYGDYGVASTSLNVKYLDENSKLCIIRAYHGPHRFLTSIIPLCNLAGKEFCRYRTLYVGATIRQCKKYITKFERQFLDSKIGSFRNDLERDKFFQDVSLALSNLNKV